MNRTVLKNPHISEKSTRLMNEKNVYTFIVQKDANKIEVRKAVENKYEVEVAKVRMSTTPPKPRRLGRQEGEKKGFKKALVKLKEGENIELLST